MKVAVVEPVGRGGLIHYAFQLCRGLAAAGAEVTLVTGRRNEVEGLPREFELVPLLDLWDAKPEEPDGGRRNLLTRLVTRLGRGLRYFREWGRLVAWLRRRDFDVVQLGDVRFAAELPFLALLRGGGARLADVCHNVAPFALASGSFRRHPLTAFLWRRIYRRFDLVFVHFEVNRRRFLEAYGLPAERVRALPMGHGGLFAELRDPERTAGDLRAELEIAAGAPVVLLFGTLSPYKGVDLLIEAFPEVRRRHPGAVLVVAGHPLPGFDPAAERARAERLGVGEGVRVVPRYLPTPEVGAWMELAAVAVFPYRELFQSAAVQVPLTFGVPVVASDVGAMAETLAGGEAGVLVPPGEPAALATAVARLLDDPEAARALGRRGREIARRRFSWRRVGAAVAEGYRELLAAERAESLEASP